MTIQSKKTVYNRRTANLRAEYGECTPLSDEQFYALLTNDEKGNTVPKLVEIVLKYYPELSMFKKTPVFVSSLESINALLSKYELPELEFS